MTTTRTPDSICGPLCSSGDDCDRGVRNSDENAMLPMEASVLSVLRAMSAGLMQVAGDRCWSMADAEVGEAVAVAMRVRAQADEVAMRLIAAAASRDLPAGRGATSTAAWVAATQLVSRAEAGRLSRLAVALDGRYELTRQALAADATPGDESDLDAAGSKQVEAPRVGTEQADAITRALEELRPALSSSDLVDAERWLVQQAAMYGPDELRRLGQRVFEYIDPDRAERHEGQLLEAAERRALEQSRLFLRRRGDGTTSGAFRLPDFQADMLRTALDAIISPRRRHLDVGSDGDAGGDRDTGDARRGDLRAAGVVSEADSRDEEHREPETRPYPVRLGQALGELIEHLPVGELPQAGGVAATICVTIDHRRLLEATGAATLSSGTTISAAQTRRLACNAGVLPMILGGESRVLDLGRSRRFHSRAQRIAIGTVQHGCIWPGCDRPPQQCEIHHPHAWSQGGHTNLDAAMVCSRHHHLAHQEWDIRISDDNIPEVLPPATIDPRRTPRRHRRFHPPKQPHPATKDASVRLKPHRTDGRC